jgi:hypothetical protein
MKGVTLTAQRLLRLLIEDDDALSGVNELGGGHQSGKPGPDNDCIGVVRHASPLGKIQNRRRCARLIGQSQLTPNASRSIV